MTKLTTEEMQRIVDGAPDDYYSVITEVFGHPFDYSHEDDIHNLNDLRTILAQQQEIVSKDAEIARLRERLNKYPMQPISKDEHGRDRFEANPIVEYIATEVCDLNKIAVWCAQNKIDEKYQEQLAQLIGYSVYGYGTLSYVSDESYERASQLWEQSK